MRAILQSIWDRTALVLGTGFGFGYAPVVPGTFGSLWGLALAWGLPYSGLPPAGQSLVVAVLFVIGIPICRRAAELLGNPDPPAVVFDEIAALPVVYLASFSELNVTTGIAGFVWFRIFDVVKPWPVRWFDRLAGGLGIMSDDVAAALYAAAALWLTVRGLTWFGFTA